MKRIFIHIPKTGGKAINKCDQIRGTISQPQRQHLNAQYLIDAMKDAKKHNRSIQVGHCRWKDLDESYSNTPAFSMVRNPWSKLVSQFMFGKQLIQEGHGGKFLSFNKTTPFEEFLNLRNKRIAEPYNWHRTVAAFHQQMDHVTDDTGKLRCDILRFEHYEEDTTKYFNLTSPIKENNVSNVKKQDYREFYNDVTKELVADWYARDIEFFGFTFDGSATKNIWNTK